MTMMTNRRAVLAGLAGASAMLSLGMSARAQQKIVLRLSSPATPTDQRALGLINHFGPAVSAFADFQPHWNAILFKQGTELEAISRGNLEMSIASAQELSTIFPQWSIFTAGYLLRSAEHQKNVFASDVMTPMKQMVEDKLGVKLISVMYLGKRHVNLRSDKEIKTPADLAGVKLRMPPSESWQFLGKALGANPLPMAFPELYTALQVGAIDGQDNPLPTVRDSKFYEVTKQIVLTAHLVDWNFLTLGKKVWDKFTPDQQKIVQKAADDACEAARQAQLKLESELEAFMKEKGLKVYAPDLNAFRTTVQKAYLESKFAKDWPAGMVDKINAIPG
ncbi:TRAP transporter substrate-binding protein DctP [Rhabdaerophilum calidifontis]|uniref:TRAP transporter substrate-binding protein DctP n=1 Tax=Rhabdaerophilum calidifontis TaxID=2604328 RepID=UPI00123B5E60|nr:TRAP transporter substrate-binding protein DctP [Rhabdaerophilum calidifontis]